MYFLLLGQQQATVVCASTTETFAESSCPTELKPLSEAKPCNKGVCSNYQWAVNDGTCSKTCGGGMFYVFYFTTLTSKVSGMFVCKR